MKIIAIKHKSTGNDSVGEMWDETKIFESTVTLEEVMKWRESDKQNIILSIPDGEAK